jgi:hypothetical protein
MKKIILLTIVCSIVFISNTFAQKIIEKTLPYNSAQKIDMNLKFGDHIQVNAWDKKEVYIKAVIEVNGGKLNDALLMNFTSDKDAIRVLVDFDKQLIKQGRREDCPSQDGSFRGYHDGNNYICSTITYQVYIPKGASLEMETISANIDLKEVTGSVHAKSISGYVDLHWPSKQGASVAMKTITGEVYSDLDINFMNKKDTPQIVGYLLKGTLNGGGPEVHLESISNDVFLRRAN